MVEGGIVLCLTSDEGHVEGTWGSSSEGQVVSQTTL